MPGILSSKLQMAGHEWEDWFEREELIGQISDIRVQNLQVERESVQKRTFTRWMNLHLEKCYPPIEVNDLFRDIQDGHILMALLEELSGCKLLHGFKKSSHRIFRLNNIAKVLSFLEERNVKLVSIDAADVADGNSSIILGLIWNIILFFQIKELTGNIRSQFPSCSSLSSLPTSSDSDASSTPSDERERQTNTNPLREHSKAIKKLLQWVQRRTRKYGVAVQDFRKSWTSGLAFLAVIKSIDSSLVDMRKALLRTPRENLEDAFRIAHYSLGIPRLLEPEDVTLNSPDEQSIMMYVSQFLEHFPGIEEPEEPLQVIERSVSMGRLNFRETDMDHFRNGHKGRVRERSYMFQKDSAAPPPKILISSVSEDRGIASPPFRQAAPRSWSTEDVLSDRENVENSSTDNTVREPIKDEETSNPESQSPELRDSHSPTDSALPESIIGDSNISSPDSWMESEYIVTPEKSCESQSDSSLFDSGMAWDVYRATPVELTNSDEGLAQSEDARLSDEHHESYIDEGICSLSSLESAQDRADGQREKRERHEGTDAKNKSEEVKMETQKNPDVVGAEQDQSTLDSNKDVVNSSGQSNNGTKNSTNVVDQDKMEVLITDIDAFVQNELCDSQEQDEITQGKSNKQEVQKEDTQEVNQGEISAKSSIQDDSKVTDDAEKASSISQEVTTHLGHGSGITIPLISISSEPDDQELSESDVGEHYGKENVAQTDVSESKETVSSGENDFESHEVIASCFITEHIDLIASEETSGFKNGHLDEEFEIVEPSNGKEEEYVELVEDVLPNNDSKLHSDEQEMVILVSDHQKEPCSTLSANETTKTVEAPVDSVKPNGSAVSIANDSSRDESNRQPIENLVDLEPMDLFYPDKEEPMIAEQAEADVQSWPSVLSVSPLQPAPVSQDPPEDDSLTHLEEDWTGDAVEMETAKMVPGNHVQVSASPFDAQDSLGDKTRADPVSDGEDIIDLRADLQHSTPSAQDGADPMRSYINSCSAQDGNQIPPVLRHRKGTRFTESMDNQKSITSTANKDHISDYGLGDSWEPYVLLLLWLLLYCFWVVPQLDLNTVPSLFFNIRQ